MFALRTPDQLSAYLRSLRKSRGLTQRALGGMLGVSAARVAMIESRPGAVAIAQLMEILHLLGARLHLDEGGTSATGVVRTGQTTPTGEW